MQDQQKNLNHKSNQKNSNNTNLSHNNSAYKGAQDNRSKQLNPNNKK